MARKKTKALTVPDVPVDKEKRCTAKSKQSGKRCKRLPAIGCEVCSIHGGKTPQGIASPQYKHGRFSRVLPSHLADKYEEIKADPDLVSNRPQLALVQTMLEDRLKEIYENVPPEAWKVAGELFREHHDATHGIIRADPVTGQAKEPRDPEEILNDLGHLLAVGIKSSEAFELCQGMLETHRKAVDTEYKLKKEDQSRMDVAEVKMFAARLARSVKDHVKDPEILRLIEADMRRVVTV